MHIVDKLFYFPIFAPIISFQDYFYKIQLKKHDIIFDLSIISALSEEKQEENDRFSQYLKSENNLELDSIVFELNRNVSQLVDCQLCGNCCKTLMIVVTEEEAEKVSKAIKSDRSDFDQQYLEKGSHGLMIMNKMPCHFLENNSCTIYSNRFEGCREFPALDLPDFHKRIFTHFMHYDRCPIIFNVIEKLKIELDFKK